LHVGFGQDVLVEAVGQSGRVGQQVVHGQRGFQRLGLIGAFRTRHQHLHVSEGRDELGDRVVQVKETALIQHHQGGGGDRFGHGVDTDQRFRRVGRTGFNVGLAIVARPGNGTLAGDQRRSEGKTSAINVAAHPVVDAGETGGVEATGGGG
jgi:hypothetical protein